TRHSRGKLTVGHFQFTYLGFVGDFYAELCRRGIVSIHHRLAAAEHEEITAREMQSAAQWLLPAHAVGRHPITERFRLANGQTSQTLVGRAAGDAEKIPPKLFFIVRRRDKV